MKRKMRLVLWILPLMISLMIAGSRLEVLSEESEETEIMPEGADEAEAEADPYVLRIKLHVNGGTITTGTGYPRYRVRQNLVQIKESITASWKNLIIQVPDTEGVYAALPTASELGITKAGCYLQEGMAYNTKNNGSGLSVSDRENGMDGVYTSDARRLNSGAALTQDTDMTLYFRWVFDAVLYPNGGYIYDPDPASGGYDEPAGHLKEISTFIEADGSYRLTGLIYNAVYPLRNTPGMATDYMLPFSGASSDSSTVNPGDIEVYEDNDIYYTWYTRDNYVFGGFNTVPDGITYHGVYQSRYDNTQLLARGSSYFTYGDTQDLGKLPDREHKTVTDQGIAVYAQWSQRVGTETEQVIAADSASPVTIRPTSEEFYRDIDLSDTEIVIPLSKTNQETETVDSAHFKWQIKGANLRLVYVGDPYEGYSINEYPDETPSITLKERAYDLRGNLYDVKITLSHIVNQNPWAGPISDYVSSYQFQASMTRSTGVISLYTTTGCSVHVDIQLFDAEGREADPMKTFLLFRDIDMPDGVTLAMRNQVRYTVNENGYEIAPFQEALTIPAESILEKEGERVIYVPPAGKSATIVQEIQTDNGTKVRIGGTEYTGDNGSRLGNQVPQPSTYYASFLYMAYSDQLSFDWTGMRAGTVLFDQPSVYTIESFIVDEELNLLDKEDWGGYISLAQEGPMSYPAHSGAVYRITPFSGEEAVGSHIPGYGDTDQYGYTISHVWISRFIPGETEESGYWSMPEPADVTGLNETGEPFLPGSYEFRGITTDYRIYVSFKRVMIQAEKTDALTGERLTGAVLSMYRQDEVGDWLYLGDMEDQGDGTHIYIPAFSAAGNSYKIEETYAPPGYSVSQEPIFFDLHESTEFSFMISDEPFRGQVIVTKTDAASGEVLTGAGFSVFAYQASAGGFSEEPYAVMTDQGDGTYEASLIYHPENQGRFMIRETEAPVGYENAHEIRYIRLTASGQVITDGTVSFEEGAAEEPLIFIDHHTLILTELLAQESQSHAGIIAEREILEDTVFYEHTNPGMTYQVYGRLMDETGSPVILDGDPVISQTVTFVPETNAGTVEEKLIYTVDPSRLAGRTVTAFTYMVSDAGDLIIAEEDLLSEAQSVHYADMRTEAKDEETGEKKGTYGRTSAILDTVDLANLVPGYQYVLKTQVIYAGEGETALFSDGEEQELLPGSPLPLVISEENGTLITAPETENIFTAEAADSLRSVTVSFDTGDMMDVSVVVFQRLYLKTENGEFLVKEEADLREESQTVSYTAVRKITVRKHIDNRFEPFGKATFLFELTGFSKRGTYVRRTKLVTINGTSSEDDVIFAWTDIPVGTYVLKEIPVLRYYLTEITWEDPSEVVLSEEDTLTMRMKALVDLTRYDASLTFKNRFLQYEKESHNDHVINHIGG